MAFFNEGRHRVKVTGHEQGESAKKRTPYLEIKFDVVAELDEHGQATAVGKQFERSLRVYLTEKAERYRDAEFEALGREYSPEPDWLLGTEQVAYCRHEGGYERWSFVPPKDGNNTAKRSTEPKQTASKRPEPAPIPSNDDIPF